MYSLSTGQQNLVNHKHIGMLAADLIALCCHLAQQNEEQGNAAKKLLRTLFGAYDQDGIKTATNLIIRNLESNPAEIAALAAPHIEISRAFPVVEEGDE